MNKTSRNAERIIKNGERKRNRQGKKAKAIYNLVERLVENDLAEDVIATKDIAYCSSVRP